MMKLYDIAEPSKPKPKGLAVGIDLGTTNSIIAFAADGNMQLLADPYNNKVTIPSAVSYQEDNTIRIGAAALVAHQPITSIKRLMGKSHQDATQLPNIFPLIANKKLLQVQTAAGAKTAEEISAVILRHLKQIAENTLGQPVTHAVITVPAYFDDAARNATKIAAQLAGLEVLRLINEPTAASLAYGLDSHEEGVFAVYDLGGGTFDVSILKRHMGVFRVLATGGDTSLGGDDFDNAIAHYLAHKYNYPVFDAKTARQVKEYLTANKVWRSNIPIQAELTQEELTTILMPFITKTLRIFKKVVRDAGIAFSDLQEVVLVGGSTKTPAIQENLQKLIGKQPLSSHDPETIVAEGAALQAAALSGQTSSLLLDVLPISLGLELMGDIVEKIIPRNTLIPAEISKTFTTHVNGQTAFKLHILQGEGENLQTCRSLARFELTGLQPLPAGQIRLQVTFTVDADGILTVSARDEATGLQKEVMVNPSYGLSAEDMLQLVQQGSLNLNELAKLIR